MTRLTTTRWIAGAILIVSALGLTVAAGPSSTAMAAAATKFLESLTPEQRQQATFAFDGEERTHWNFIPTEIFPRNGLTIRQMNQSQRTLAHDLLKTGLSQRGYMTATQIMELENVLAAIETAQRAAAPPPHGNPPFARDPEKYFFSIFGSPSTQNTWGWRVEGHHMSLHFTVVDGKLVAGSPIILRIQSRPKCGRGPKKGTRVLGPEEDAARALIESLDASQRERAIINTTAPNDIVTMANVKIDPLSPAGIPASALTASQRSLLRKLIDVYTGKMADDIAADRLARIEKAGWDQGSVRLGRSARARTEALLPRAGADISDRVRQHAERWEPHSLGLARVSTAILEWTCCAST